MPDFVHFIYAIVFLASGWSAIFIGKRILISWGHLSRGQKWLTVSLFFWSLGGLAGGLQSMLTGSVWRWSFIPSMVAAICAFGYSMEPKQLYIKRRGRDAFDPKGPGEL